MQRQRVSADYLQTSSVIDSEGTVHSAVNDPNLYSGPGTGYRLEGERWTRLHASAVRARSSSARRGGGRWCGRGRRRAGRGGSGRAAGRGRHRDRAGVRRGDPTDDRRPCPPRRSRGARRGRSRRRAASRASSGCVEPRTSPSSDTTARSCRAPVSRSASSRRAPRSSTAPISSRSTTSSSSAWRLC